MYEINADVASSEMECGKKETKHIKYVLFPYSLFASLIICCSAV